MSENEYYGRVTDHKLDKSLLLGIIIFTIGTFTLDTFISSPIIKFIYLITTILIFIIYYILNKKGLEIYTIELFWFLFFFYYSFNFLIHGEFKLEYSIDVLVFSLLFVFLLLVKVDIEYYKLTMIIMFVLAIVFALSSVFQFLNMDLYSRVILPRFNEAQQTEILRIYNRGSYTGFTRQTAYISGYLVYGIAIALIMLKVVKIRSWKIIILGSIPLLIFALFLGGKRAHLLFMILALLVTYLFSTNKKKFTVQFLKLVFGLLAFIISLILIIVYYTPSPESQFGKIYGRFEKTIEGLITGEDITSGRTILYDYAIKLFYDNPLLGIGWRKYNELTYGLLSSTSGSHPHNIYLQLLTELGIIGLLLFIIPVIYMFIITIKLLVKSDQYLKASLQFSLFVQTFFVLYGFTENLLTDHLYILMYILASSITLSSIKYMRKVSK